jgi:hypothetical protein
MRSEPAGNCTAYAPCGVRGLTLVELTISMLIMAAIAGTGGRLFLTALSVSGELDDRARARQSAVLIIDQLRQDAANLIPARIREIEPYEELIDPTKGAMINQLLIRIPQGYSTDLAPPDAQAMIVRYAVSLNPDQSLSLSRSRQFFGASGAIGEPISGVLAHNIGDFSLLPIYRNTGGGGSSGGETVSPSGIEVHVRFNLGKNEVYSISHFLPAPAQGPSDK